MKLKTSVTSGFEVISRLAADSPERLTSAIGRYRAERKAALFGIRFYLRRFREKSRARAENALIESANFEVAFDSARLNDAAR